MIPETFSVPVELHDLEGLRYHDIAEIIGVPLGTVMSRIYRGRKLLASLISAHSARWDLPRAGRQGPQESGTESIMKDRDQRPRRTRHSPSCWRDT
jgi:RNA polymerase sigma-70 factor (ECF subfamily)